MSTVWEDVRVVHFDGHDREGNRRLHPAESGEPTPLAPWRTWLCGGYVPCRDASAFRDALLSSHGPTFAVLHETDLNAARDAIDLSDWLQAAAGQARPGRLLFLYSMRWGSWADCKSDMILPVVRGRLPDALCQVQWAAFPWDDLCGPPRPAAWLGRVIVYEEKVDIVSAPFRKWRDTACGDNLSVRTGGVSGSEAVATLRSKIQRHLVEWFDTEHCRTDRPADKRRAAMLGFGDDLWLLEGVAAELGWTDLLRLAQRVRCDLQSFLGRCCAAADLRPEGKPSWQPTITAIETTLAEYR